MYVDPIIRQTYNYATPIPCNQNPRNNIELDPDTDDQGFFSSPRTYKKTSSYVYS